MKSSAYAKSVAPIRRDLRDEDKRGFSQVKGSNKNGVRDARIFLPKTTSGHLPVGKPAFIYVGLKTCGRIKVGMSTQPQERCRKLGVQIAFLWPVTNAAAKEVETETHRILGHPAECLEEFSGDLTTVIEAVVKARDLVGRRMHADPALTEDEARQPRIGIAA